MFFKILLILSMSIFFLTSLSEANLPEFQVIVYKEEDQQGVGQSYSLFSTEKCLDVPGSSSGACTCNDRSVERIHGGCLFICNEPCTALLNRGTICKKLERSERYLNVDMKVMSISKCFNRVLKVQKPLSSHSVGENSRDLREFNYYYD